MRRWMQSAAGASWGSRAEWWFCWAKGGPGEDGMFGDAVRGASGNGEWIGDSTAQSCAGLYEQDQLWLSYYGGGSRTCSDSMRRVHGFTLQSY